MESGLDESTEVSQESVTEESQPQDNTQVDGNEEQPIEQQEVEETLPFGKHPRWQKMTEQNREYKRQMREMQEQLKALSNAQLLHDRLSQNPKHLKTVLDLITGETQEVENKDPEEDLFQDYEPHERKALLSALRAEKELKQLKEQLESQRKEQELSVTQEREQSLQYSFIDLLKSDGIINDDPSPTAIRRASMIGAMLDAVLDMQGIEPTKANQQQIKEAYKEVMTEFSAIKKETKQETLREVSKTKRVAVPASGNNQGGVSSQNGKMSDEERLLRVRNMILKSA